MKRALSLLILTFSFSFAHAYPSGCQDQTNKFSQGAIVRINGDKNMEIGFSSVAACEAQMDYLRAQPNGIVCGCQEKVRVDLLTVFLLGFTGNYEKSVKCYRLKYNDSGEKVTHLEEVQTKNPFSQFNRNSGAPAPDPTVAQECAKKESESFAAMKTNPAEIIVEAVDNAKAAN